MRNVSILVPGSAGVETLAWSSTRTPDRVELQARTRAPTAESPRAGPAQAPAQSDSSLVCASAAARTERRACPTMRIIHDADEAAARKPRLSNVTAKIASMMVEPCSRVDDTGRGRR